MANTVVNLLASALIDRFSILYLIQGLPIALKMVMPSQNQTLRAASKPQK
jgi:hypothetical protein